MTQPVRHDDKQTSVPAMHAVHLPDSERSAAAESSDCPDLQRITLAVREAVGEQNFLHWFYRRTRFEIQGDRLIVRVPNPFVLNWLLRRFRSVLNSAAQKVLGLSASSQLEVDESLMLQVAAEPSLTVGSAVDASGSAVGSGAFAGNANITAAPSRLVAQQSPTTRRVGESALDPSDGPRRWLCRITDVSSVDSIPSSRDLATIWRFWRPDRFRPLREKSTTHFLFTVERELERLICWRRSIRTFVVCIHPDT